MCKEREKGGERASKGRRKERKRLGSEEMGGGMEGKGWGIRKRVGKEQGKGEERRKNGWVGYKRVGKNQGKGREKSVECRGKDGNKIRVRNGRGMAGKDGE